MKGMRSMTRLRSTAGLAQILMVLALLLVAACGRAAPVVPAATTEATPGASSPTGELTVFAAASLTEAFEEIGGEFEAANPGTEVTFNFAGSQQLAQQLAQGAPADVFASANPEQMDVAVEAGRVEEGSVRELARNRLVVIYPKANPAKLRTLHDLAREGVKLDLADKAAPAGRYSLRFLDAAAKAPRYGEAYKEAVLRNVVSYEENVRAVVGKVSLGEADAGIVYESDLRSAEGKLGAITIPDELNQIATYPVAPTTGGENGAVTERFVAHLLSPAGQRVLARYGFLPVEGR